MIKIRSASAKDAPAIAKLSGELGYAVGVEETTRRLQILLCSAVDMVFVAETQGSVIGWTHVTAMLSLEYGSRAEVFGLVVAEGLRGQGVGRLLMLAAEAWAVRHGLPLLRLRTNVSRADAHAFYERLGYTMAKQQRVYEKLL